MGVEIERKFLVGDPSLEFLVGVPGMAIDQGYLSLDADRTVRVRRASDRGFLTIKGRGLGISRAEFEYEIPIGDVGGLLSLCVGSIVTKTRYRVPAGHGLAFEVDVFGGDNAGLVVAELELPSENAPFARPDWLGREVSHDPSYLNANLAVRPFRDW